MLKQLIYDKINEVFLEYQQENNITSGDISPEDMLELDELEDALAELIERVCAKQPRAINYDDFTPSWYIYTNCDGEPRVQTFSSALSNEGSFFIDLSRRICFDDLDDCAVHKIFYKGKEIEYAGWQPGMKYEYKDLDGNTVWVGYFPEWDH